MRANGLAESRGAESGSTRLDPRALPYFAPPQVQDGLGAALLYLDGRRVLLRRANGPAALVHTVATSAYRGVAVRIAARGSAGAIEAVLELFHREPSLRVRLATSDDPAAIAAQWESWGEALQLPLLFVDRDGTVTEHSAERHLSVSAPCARRRRAFHGGRRPRFLQRRKVGVASGETRLAGREIIARS